MAVEDAERLDLEPLLAHIFPLFQFGRGAFENHLPMAHDIDAVRDIKRDGQLLFHQQG